jgi:hypothetical protein
VIGIMHLNKRTDTDVLGRVNGSVGFGASARSVLLCAADPEDVEGPIRLLAHAKCNVGPLSTTLRMRVEGREGQARDGTPIQTSGIAWAGEAASVTAADLVRPLEDEEVRSAKDEAITFLKTVLENGPQKATAVRCWAHEAGIADRTLDRAKPRAVKVVRVGGLGKDGYWMWHLKDATDPLSTPSKNRAPLGEPGALRGENGEKKGETGSTVADAVEIFAGSTVVACPTCGGTTWHYPGSGYREVCATCHPSVTLEREPGCDDDDPSPTWWNQ